MRKIFIVLLTIPLFFLLILGFILFDYFYYPMISSKAEKAAETYLEEKYKEDFVITDANYSKQLGEDWGDYEVQAYPAKDANVTVDIFVTEDMVPTFDDYLETKWRAELNKQFGSLYQELYGPPENYSYMVNVSFPEGIHTKYNSSYTYQEIMEKEAKGIGNIVFANVLLKKSNEMDNQLDKVYKLIQHLKRQELERFSIRIEYFNESLQGQLSDEDKKLDYKDFLRKHLESRDYVFEFSYESKDESSKKRLENIKTPADLKQYLQKQASN